MVRSYHKCSMCFADKITAGHTIEHDCNDCVEIRSRIMISNHCTITWLWHNDPCQPLYDFILAEDNIVWLSRPRQYENWILLWKFTGTTPVWKRDFVIIIQFESWICLPAWKLILIDTIKHAMVNEMSRQYEGWNLWPWRLTLIEMIKTCRWYVLQNSVSVESRFYATTGGLLIRTCSLRDLVIFDLRGIISSLLD